jgi:hypothetical protein
MVLSWVLDRVLRAKFCPVLDSMYALLWTDLRTVFQMAAISSLLIVIKRIVSHFKEETKSFHLQLEFLNYLL